jgi:succinate dehydrogenase/fumarate reductase flavoprotein subunit
MLLSCQVFGRRAARAASAEAQVTGNPPQRRVQRLVGAAVERYRTAVPGGGATSARELVRRLQTLMSEDVLVDRDDSSLASAQKGLQDLSQALSGGEVGVGTTAERLAAEDARNLLTAGQLMVAASRARTETRGAHYRNDFTSTDPAQARRQRWRWDASGPVAVPGG